MSVPMDDQQHATHEHTRACYAAGCPVIAEAHRRGVFYLGPLMGPDGLPVPCQVPGCSRRAATKSKCTRHRGLPEVHDA